MGSRSEGTAVVKARRPCHTRGMKLNPADWVLDTPLEKPVIALCAVMIALVVCVCLLGIALALPAVFR